jgi:endonuclease/exonuclease/phosphatase family metal-dependent hydrolase
MPIVPSAQPVAARAARWRAVARVALWVMAIAWSAFTALRIVGWEAAWPLVAALAYTPYVALASLVPLGAAAGLRAWRPLAVLGACTVVLAALVLPRAFPAASPPAAGPTLRVMTVNMLAGAGDAETVAAIVRDHRVDVLTVQELTFSGVDALAAAGIDALLPHQEVRAGTGAEGSGVYARLPFTPAPGLEPDSYFEMPGVRIEVPGAEPVELLAVHPVPPLPRQVPTWSRELGDLPPATPDGAVRILAGDFNATLDHDPMQALLATGYADAGDAAGAGLAGTWQSTRGIGSLLPPVTLDRVLVDRRVSVDHLSVHRIPGSDHRSVLAELTLPASAA